MWEYPLKNGIYLFDAGRYFASGLGLMKDRRLRSPSNALEQLSAHKSDPTAASGTLADLLQAMRSLAVILVAIGVLRADLLQFNQECDKSF